MPFANSQKNQNYYVTLEWGGGGVWGGVEVACDERCNLGKNKDSSFPRGTEAGIRSFCIAVILAEVCLSYNLKNIHSQ